VLSVLDGAVLVISAVEGVQAQTASSSDPAATGIPRSFFVNKIDDRRAVPRDARGHRRQLSPAIIPMVDRRPRQAVPPGRRPTARPTLVHDRAGQRDRRSQQHFWPPTLGRDSDFVQPAHDELASQTRQAIAHPVFFGSAITGAGVEALTAGITELSAAACGDG